MRRSRTFPGSQKPDEEGVYERRYPSGDWWYSRWHNGAWGPGHQTPDNAADSVIRSGRQNLPWRGLARKPT